MTYVAGSRKYWYSNVKLGTCVQTRFIPLLGNQNSEFKTQLHVYQNCIIDLTQNFYPGNPERQVLESNRERQESNHERQKVKSRKKKTKKKKTKQNKKKKTLSF